MPIDEEQPEFVLEINKDATRTIQSMFGSAVAAGLVSFLESVRLAPFGIGAAISELTTGLAIRRTNERMKDMFEYFTNRVREVGEEKVNREWFRSEEFQTLLYEALRQLHVTHDREKIEMLGVALANSGTSDFKGEDRKDLFIRFVRELTLQHIKMLVELAPTEFQFGENSAPQPRPESLPDEWELRLRWNRRPTLSPKDDDLLALQMLHAYGLVEEKLKSSIKQARIPSTATGSQLRDAMRKFSKNIENPKVTRSFRLSPLGDDFLKFTGLPKAQASAV